METFVSEVIYCKDAAGRIRQWHFEVSGAQWRAHSGLKDGNLVTSGWTTCKPKNVGKKNERTAEQQAEFEANAEFDKKLDRNYRRLISDLDLVPPSPMLAQEFAKQKKVAFPCYMQPKLDGIRALISRHGAFTREYQRHHNVEHILEVLEPVFVNHPDLVLDGELYNHDLRDDFNTISSVVRKENVTDEDRARAKELIQYHVYDFISHQPFQYRHTTLAAMLWPLEDDSSVKFVDTVAVTADNHDTMYEEFLRAGYEGGMYRTIDGAYEVDKRSKFLLKRKNWETAEFLCKRLEEGEGTWAGYAKGVVLALPEGWPENGQSPMDGASQEHRECGAGIRGTMPFCKQLLADADKYEMVSVTVRYQGVTPDGQLRFPTVIDFHPKGRRD